MTASKRRGLAPREARALFAALFVIALGGALVAWRWAVTRDARRIAASRAAWLHENCPDLASFDECWARLAVKNDEADRATRAAQQRARDDADAAAAGARAARVAQLRADQNAHPEKLAGLLYSVAWDASSMHSTSRCQPFPHRGSERIDHDDHEHALRVSRDLDEIVGDMSKTQAEGWQHLRLAVDALLNCWRCDPAVRPRCGEFDAELERARRLIPPA